MPTPADIQKLVAAGRLEQAAREARVLAALHSRSPEAQRLAASLLIELERADEALPFSRRLWELDPDNAEYAASYAWILRAIGKAEEALAVYQRARLSRPLDADLTAGEVGVLVELGRLGEADAACEGALARGPESAALLAAWANVRQSAGRADDSLPLARRAVELGGPDPALLSTLAICSLYASTPTPEELLGAFAYLGRVTHTLNRRPPAPPIPPLTDRLRVGFISADFREHSVTYFVEPLLASLDRSRVEVHVYNTNRSADAVTARLRRYPCRWRDLGTSGMDRRWNAVRADNLHVLIDLMGWTLGGSMNLLARRAAPLQVLYAGFATSPGAPFIDARIVDGVTDPDDGRRHDIEELIRLPAPFLCYAPPAVPDVRPRDPDARPTFGCFGLVSKYSDSMLGMWAGAMSRVPGARLVLKARAFGDGPTRDAVLARLAARGVDPSRVEMLPPTRDAADHRAMYHHVDVALDTYPYHGTTTTCEAMLMGVPSVVRVGQAHRARVGLTLLRAVGLEDLAADSDEGFARTAAGLITDAARLADLRLGLRRRLLESPLTDRRGFAQKFEATLRAWVVARIAQRQSAASGT
jgi:protein O-GlcNAc transferase